MLSQELPQDKTGEHSPVWDRLRDTPLAPVYPLRRDMSGHWGRCQSARAGLNPETPYHFRYLTYQTADGEPICEQCALTFMDLSGRGRRLPHEREIPVSLGGQYDPARRRIIAGYRRLAGRKRKPRTDREQKFRRRKQAVVAALASGPKLWQELARLEDGQGKVFRSEQAVRHFMKTRMEGEYSARRLGPQKTRIYLREGARQKYSKFFDT